MRILFIAEIVGKKGLNIVSKLLPELKTAEQIDFVIANGNRIDNGFSVIESDVETLHNAGVDVITLGDNCFKKRATVELLGHNDLVLRPVNSFFGNPGRGFTIKKVHDGTDICVISAFGRTNFRNPILDDPFQAVKRTLKQIPEEVKIIVVDFHANATSEKLCMGNFLSGKVTAVIGTHYAIQTADLRLDDSGTAYISDLGKVGSNFSVGGYEPGPIIEAYLTAMQPRKRVRESDYIFNSLIVEADPQSGRALSAKLHNLQIDPC